SGGPDLIWEGKSISRLMEISGCDEKAYGVLR
ncbi:hypothetical protein A2U01_0094155, partial [Trifolium medium]|nr:hypothetical protein [Trifolium medium]